MGEARISAVGVRYYGELAAEDNRASRQRGPRRSALGHLVVWRRHAVNARTVAGERGIELIESRSTRARNYTSLISVKLHTDERRAMGRRHRVRKRHSRLVLIDGVAVESPLEGTLLIVKNNDQPGVIGEVGTCSAGTR